VAVERVLGCSRAVHGREWAAGMGSQGQEPGEQGRMAGMDRNRSKSIVLPSNRNIHFSRCLSMFFHVLGGQNEIACHSD
jgi:hypothetical protein